MDCKDITARVAEIFDERPVTNRQENALNYNSPLDRLKREDSDALYQYLAEHCGYHGETWKIFSMGYREVDKILAAAGITYRTFFDDIIHLNVPALTDDESCFLDMCGAMDAGNLERMERIVGQLLPSIVKKPELERKSPSARLKDLAPYRLERGMAQVAVEEFNSIAEGKEKSAEADKASADACGEDKRPEKVRDIIVFPDKRLSLLHTAIPFRAVPIFAKYMDVSVYWAINGFNNTLYAETPQLENLLGEYTLLTQYGRQIAAAAANKLAGEKRCSV